MPNDVQSNTKIGAIQFLAKGDLTGLEGYLLQLINDSGVCKVQVPAAADTECQFVLDEGGADGEWVKCLPLDPNRNIRMVGKTAITAGTRCVLADPGTAADKGKIRAVPAGAGDYWSPGFVEELSADGNWTRVRPAPKIVTVTE